MAAFSCFEPSQFTCPPAAPEYSSSTTDISALVDSYAQLLYRCAYSLVRNQADAEDVVQETFIRVLRHSSELAGIENIRVWLVRIAWNYSRDLLRKRKTRPAGEDIADVVRLLPSKDMSPLERCLAAERHATVLAHFEQLPLKEREVLMLSAFQEFTSVEIADILQTSESSVRSRLFRARNLMAAKMDRVRQKPTDRKPADQRSLSASTRS